MSQLPNGQQSPGARVARSVAVFCVVLAAIVAIALTVDVGARTGVARDAVEVAMHPVAVAPVVSAVLGADAPTGTLTGTITLDGNPPVLPPAVKKGDMSVKNPEVCALEEVPNEDLVVNPKNKGIKNVFVYLQRAPAGVTVPKPGPVPLVFDQKGCQFIPHCMLVQAGSIVLVKSNDPIGHNTHTHPLRNDAFNQSLAPNDRNGIQLKYTMGERLPVKVVCDIHPWMKAYHLVLDHPFMAVTDDDGNFTIKDLPAGKHEFIVWQEKVGYLDRKYPAEVKAGEEKKVQLKFPAAKFAGQ
jgi:hypothetical protein